MSTQILAESWDTAITERFCEGTKIPYLIPGIFEFFSMLSGIFLVVIGFAGNLQPNLSVMYKLIYGGICVNGIGTILLHIRPIELFKFFEAYPLVFTLALCILAVFEDSIEEFVFREKEEEKAGRPTKGVFCGFSLLHGSTFRVTLYNAVMLFLGGIYLLTGAILVVFSEQFFTFDITDVYFGIPYLLATTAGVQYISNAKHITPEIDRALRRLKFFIFFANVSTVVFRMIDAYACTHVTVWFFCIPIYNIMKGITLHCLMVFLAYARVTRGLIDQIAVPEVSWVLCLFPHITIPPVGRLGYVGSGFQNINYA